MPHCKDRAYVVDCRTRAGSAAHPRHQAVTFHTGGRGEDYPCDPRCPMIGESLGGVVGCGLGMESGGDGCFGLALALVCPVGSLPSRAGAVIVN